MNKTYSSCTQQAESNIMEELVTYLGVDDICINMHSNPRPRTNNHWISVEKNNCAIVGYEFSNGYEATTSLPVAGSDFH